MDHEEHFFTRVEWRVAVPSVRGKWSVEANDGVDDKTEIPFDWWQIQGPAPATSEARLVYCRSQDRQRLAEAPTTINWRPCVRACVSCVHVCEWVLDVTMVEMVR